MPQGLNRCKAAGPHPASTCGQGSAPKATTVAVARTHAMGHMPVFQGVCTTASVLATTQGDSPGVLCQNHRSMPG